VLRMEEALHRTTVCWRWDDGSWSRGSVPPAGNLKGLTVYLEPDRDVQDRVHPVLGQVVVRARTTVLRWLAHSPHATARFDGSRFARAGANRVDPGRLARCDPSR
jgi:hypothetical protein